MKIRITANSAPVTVYEAGIRAFRYFGFVCTIETGRTVEIRTSSMLKIVVSSTGNTYYVSEVAKRKKVPQDVVISGDEDFGVYDTLPIEKEYWPTSHIVVMGMRWSGNILWYGKHPEYGIEIGQLLGKVVVPFEPETLQHFVEGKILKNLR